MNHRLIRSLDQTKNSVENNIIKDRNVNKLLSRLPITSVIPIQTKQVSPRHHRAPEARLDYPFGKL